MSKIRLSNMIYRKLFFLVTFCLFKTVIAQVNYDSIFQKAMQKMNNQDFSNAYWELKLIDFFAQNSLLVYDEKVYLDFKGILVLYEIPTKEFECST